MSHTSGELRPRAWVRVTPEEAARHPDYGLIGWPLLLAVSLGAGVLTTVRGYVLTGLPDLTRFPDAIVDVWTAIIIIDAAYVLLAALSIALLFAKSRAFRPVALLLLWLWFANTLALPFIIDYMTEKMRGISDVDFKVTDSVLRDILRGLVMPPLWTIYFYVSKKINVTIYHRVRARELPLVQPT